MPLPSKKRGILQEASLGAENGTRTRDLNLGKVALYQLSYFRIGIANIVTKFDLTNFFSFCASALKSQVPGRRIAFPGP